MATPTSTPAARNLVDTVSANDNFSTFRKALSTAGLVDALRAPGPFTVFAPTDAAFALLPNGRLDALMQPENKPELISIINYHIIKGRKSAADVGKWVTAHTINGQSAPVRLHDGQVSIDGAGVTHADIASSNGMLHGIDKVNLPKSTLQ
ncbi:MAG: fasciclin domain-containing protein [Dokdonella sp.]